MLKTLGIVEACFRSADERFRASRRLGGKSVLEWVVRRATDCMQLCGVIVVMHDAPENGPIEKLVPPDVPVFRAARPDTMGCLVAALDEYVTETAVLIGTSNPFVDSALIDRLVREAEAQPECDYAGYSSRDGRPTAQSPVGVAVEWFRASAMRRAAHRAKDPLDRQQPTRYLLAHPEKFRLSLIPAPVQIDRDDVRLRIDGEEDFDHATTIFDALGPDLDYQRIANLLHHQPAMRRRMAAINRAAREN